MVQTIAELKTTIKDGSILTNGSDQIIIERLANNIIRIDGRLISWKRLQDVIFNSDYKLIVEKIEIKTNDRNHGGRRLARPGKKIGRPTKQDAKKAVSFSMTKEETALFDTHCKNLKVSRSGFLSILLKSYDNR
ncbi:MAG: hypothetical protein HOE02_05605 [Candidatus Marinimicrobia bacterium]|jgi:hypothetical protein|nr:hypothetical protein [Candidatus Neomarinimicrobiota bacterium]